MKNQSYLNLTSHQFKRRFGVKIQTLKVMVKALEEFRLQNPQDRRGRRTILTIEEQVLVTLEYGREYRTYFHIATNWGVSESTICRIVIDIESTLMKTGKFRLPGKKALLKNSDYPAVVAIDVTETAIERPKKNRKNITQVRKNVIPSKLNWSSIKRQEQLFALLLGKDIATILACLKKVKFIFIPKQIAYKIVGIKA